jgi:hypothetical protein
VTPAPTPKMTSTTEEESIKPSETIIDTEKQEGIDKELLSKVVSKAKPVPPSTKTPTTTIDKPATKGDTGSVASTLTVNDDAEKVMKTPRDTIAVVKGLNTAAKEKLTKPTDKATQKETPYINDTIALAVPMSKTTATTVDSAAKPSSLPLAITKPSNGAVTKPAILAKTPFNKNPQVVIPSTTKPPVTPNPATNATSITQKKPIALTPATPLNKRTVGPITGDTPDSKRTKFTPSPLTLNGTTIVPRIPPATPSARPVSIEHKVAEQRKRLESIRQKRLEMAKKQEDMNRKIEPFRKRMEEESERLEREMMEEEAAAVEDEEYLKRSEEILREFEDVGGHE